MRAMWGFCVLLLAAAGCSTAPPPEPGRGDGAILLADQRQGMLPSYELYAPPDFVLYGDGRAIVREEGDDPGVLKLVEYRLTPERVQALFDEAADAGLFDGDDYALDGQVPPDAGGLVIMVRTAAREHLARITLPSPDDSGARGEAARFAESLRPSGWADGDFAAPPAPYRPGRVAVTYTVADTESAVARTWPLPETEPVQPRCVVVTGAAATAAQELGETVGRALWRHGGVAFYAEIRPLLPDETDCESTRMRFLG